MQNVTGDLRPEYCEGMWRILQYKNAEDFVLATGETNTVRKFTELTFKELGIEIEWRGKKEKEKGYIKNIELDKAKSLIGFNTNTKNYSLDFSTKLKKGMRVVDIDPTYYRPTEVDLLIGSPVKAKKLLGWKAKTKFEDLVSIMIKSDMEKVLTRGY